MFTALSVVLAFTCSIKVSFNISCNKNRLETEILFLPEESIIKNQRDLARSFRNNNEQVQTLPNDLFETISQFLEAIIRRSALAGIHTAST